MKIYKHIKKHRLCSLFIWLFTVLSLYSQPVAKLVLNQPITSNYSAHATESISLQDGFTTNGHEFSASIVFSVPAQIPYLRQEEVPTPDIITTPTKNYIYKVMPREPDFWVRTSNENVAAITYYDGLGREEQTINVMAGPAKNDYVYLTGYDEFGRKNKKYLPFSGDLTGQYYSGATTIQESFYSPSQSPVPDYATDYAPWAVTEFEPDPISRVTEQGAPGSAWQPGTGHTINTDYQTNGTDEVMLWRAGSGLTDITQYVCYETGTLYKTVTTDENGTEITEYKNLKGDVVLKSIKNDFLQPDNTILSYYHDTYYVYDDFGMLRCVIPPEANGTVDIDYCYFYQYDARKRMIVKKIPGAEAVYMVYDDRDRLIASQDGNMRDPDGDNNTSDQTWLITKYDHLNRPVITAEYPVNENREGLQTIVDGYSTGVMFETYNPTASGNVHGYDNQSFPANLDPSYVLTVNYYDTYAAIDLSGIPELAFSEADITGLSSTDYNDFDETASDKTTGLLTVSKINILGTSDYLWNLQYYDYKARIIQTVSTNYFAGIDRVSNKYNFIGEVLATVTEHNDGSVVIGDRFVYDHTGRLLEDWQQIAGESEILLLANKYNELGEVKEMYYHGEDDGTNIYTLQKNGLSYNIRGWLSSMNDPSDLYPEETDLFAMKLFYNNATLSFPNLVRFNQYNGNIAAIEWNNAYNNVRQAYGFHYDGMNRIKNATHGTATSSFSDDQRYGVPNINYDTNGNITALQRYGNSAGSLIDDLTYSTYDGNQLINVSESSSIGDPDNGFISGNTTIYSDYEYDANGNMIIDRNKGISSEIFYNYLNLPESILFDNGNEVSYTYDAAGNKLENIDPYDKITNYINNFVYVDGSLAYILTPQGRILCEGSDYTYEYHMRDHLGNTRVAFTAEDGEAVVRQVADYYPFGMLHDNPLNILDADQRYLYNSKELQEGTDWYDYGARMYMPDLGRWTTIDPMAEKYAPISPYEYVRNNPILRLDPNGMWDVTVHVYNNREQYGYGVAVVTDRSGNEVARYNVRVIGQHRDRMTTNGDTPNGTYDIPDNNMWMSGGSVASYGPNARLIINPESGEAEESDRDEFRMHGGRQGENDWKQEPDEPLQPTNGCIRMYDDDIANMKTITDGLMENDAEEVGGQVTVVDDLETTGVEGNSVEIQYRVPQEELNYWQNFVNDLLNNSGNE